LHPFENWHLLTFDRMLGIDTQPVETLEQQGTAGKRRLQAEMSAGAKGETAVSARLTSKRAVRNAVSGHGRPREAIERFGA
jgi:hypothetical protein